MTTIWTPDSADPSAIPLQLDPREQRMSGHAIHGDTPFDVPFVSQIEGNLWTGGCAANLVLPVEIEHVVSLYPWEQYTITREPRSFLLVWLRDADVPPVERLLPIARWINDCRKDAPTLVHCQAGLNRSGLVAALALILDGMDAQAAIALLREKRSPAVLCNAGFERWLLGYEAVAA